MKKVGRSVEEQREGGLLFSPPAVSLSVPFLHSSSSFVWEKTHRSLSFPPTFSSTQSLAPFRKEGGGRLRLLYQRELTFLILENRACGLPAERGTAS